MAQRLLLVVYYSYGTQLGIGGLPLPSVRLAYLHDSWQWHCSRDAFWFVVDPNINRLANNRGRRSFAKWTGKHNPIDCNFIVNDVSVNLRLIFLCLVASRYDYHTVALRL